MKFLVRGEVTDYNNNPLSNLIVQAMDSDQGFFEDHNDDLLESASTDAKGSFEISFDESTFKDRWLENEPETYLIVRNEKGQIQLKPVSPSWTSVQLSFDAERCQRLTQDQKSDRDEQTMRHGYPVQTSQRIWHYLRTQWPR